MFIDLHQDTGENKICYFFYLLIYLLNALNVKDSPSASHNNVFRCVAVHPHHHRVTGLKQRIVTTNNDYNSQHPAEFTEVGALSK